MKYIRTKDGKRYALVKVTKNDSYEFQTNVIKEADTIEELCDEFVIKDNDTSGGFDFRLEDNKLIIKSYPNQKMERRQEKLVCQV